MMRTVLLLALLALALPAGAQEAAKAKTFWPPAEKIEKPYTDDKCLKNCHGEPGFGAGSPAGTLRTLYVDRQAYVQSIHGQKGVECVDCHVDADPNFHPRVGYPDVDCRACHSEKPPEGVYPPDALKRLQAKGIKPPPKESRKAEGWMKTKHAKAWQAGNPAAPFCNNCHTAHSVRKAADPASTVNTANLPETCGYCHVDEVRDYSVAGALARFRISGHGKGDLSNVYDVSRCVSCHQGQAAHGEETVTGQACPACHQVPEEGEGAVEIATLHIRPLAADQPVAHALSWVYRVAFWGAVAAVAVLAVFLCFSTLYRKSEEGKDDV